MRRITLIRSITFRSHSTGKQVKVSEIHKRISKNLKDSSPEVNRIVHPSDHESIQLKQTNKALTDAAIN